MDLDLDTVLTVVASVLGTQVANWARNWRAWRGNLARAVVRELGRSGDLPVVEERRVAPPGRREVDALTCPLAVECALRKAQLELDAKAERLEERARLEPEEAKS